MRKGGTDQLIADFLALTLEIEHHLHDKRRRLSLLQIDSLSDAIKTLHRYMTAWKTHELARRAAADRNNGKRDRTPKKLL